MFFVSEAIKEAKAILAKNQYKSCPISLLELPFKHVPVHINIQEYLTVQVFEEKYPEYFLNTHCLGLKDYGDFKLDQQGLLNMARFVGAQMAAYNYILKTPSTRDKAFAIIESLKDGSCHDLKSVLERPIFDEDTALEVLLF